MLLLADRTQQDTPVVQSVSCVSMGSKDMFMRLCRNVNDDATTYGFLKECNVLPSVAPPLNPFYEANETDIKPMEFDRSLDDRIGICNFYNSSNSSCGPQGPPEYPTLFSGECEQSQTNLFISNLPHCVEHSHLEDIFSSCGEILSAAVMRNIHTGESLGTAFVRYATSQQAARAVEQLSGKEIYGKTIMVQFAKRQHDCAPVGDARKKIRKLFVRNIPMDVTVENLTQLFNRFGPVKAVSVHRDTAPSSKKNAERHIAFVTYAAEGSAERAGNAVHNTRPFESCAKIPLMIKLIEDMPSRVVRLKNSKTKGVKGDAPQYPSAGSPPHNIGSPNSDQSVYCSHLLPQQVASWCVGAGFPKGSDALPGGFVMPPGAPAVRAAPAGPAMGQQCPIVWSQPLSVALVLGSCGSAAPADIVGVGPYVPAYYPPKENCVQVPLCATPLYAAMPTPGSVALTDSPPAFPTESTPPAFSPKNLYAEDQKPNLPAHAPLAMGFSIKEHQTIAKHGPLRGRPPEKQLSLLNNDCKTMFYNQSPRERAFSTPPPPLAVDETLSSDILLRCV